MWEGDSNPDNQSAPGVEPSPEKSNTPDLIRRFDEAWKTEKELGEQLDQQMVDTFKEWYKWSKDFKWTDETTPKAEDVSYKFQTIDESDVSRNIIVRPNGVRGFDAVELDNDNNFLSRISMEDYGGYMNRKYGMRIGFTTVDDPECERKERINHLTLEYSASTAYGYVSSGNTAVRGRFIAPGMEHLASPMELANQTLDKLKRGQATHKSVGEGEWEPINPQAPLASEPTA